MENGSTDFLPRLEEAIALRAAWLETVQIPQIKDLIGTYRALFESIVTTLVKKGLIREDPYNYESKANEVVVPPDSALSETGDKDEVNRRIAAYRRQLAFVADELPFTLASMSFAELKRVVSLLRFVDWEGFGEGSHSPTTRALARLVTKVRLSQDALSSRILHESQTQIEKIAKTIHEHMAELEAWHRESWKAEVRAKVLPIVQPQRARAGEERTAKTLAIRQAFEQALPEGVWHPQLVHEILGEDASPGSVERREELLASLAIPRPETSGADDSVVRKSELLDAVHSLSTSEQDIGYCQAVLVENEHGIQKRRLGFFQRIMRWFQKTQSRLDDRFYDVEYRPTPLAEVKTESINFLGFVSEMRELQAVFAEITQAEGPGYRRIQAMSEEQLCDFLDWQLRQLQPLHRRMEGLNALFQMKAVRDRGGTARSIKLELLGIQNCIVRADAVRRDSITRLEKKKQKTG